MLSIGRKPGEYVMIGDDICVKVISVDGMLRLAIEAPKEIPIVRGELYEKGLAEASAKIVAGPAKKGNPGSRKASKAVKPSEKKGSSKGIQ